MEGVYSVYNQPNDGIPNWDEELRHRISDWNTGGIAFHHKRVEAIGVFDTVPARGLSRDDFPDNQRTELYARRGYHALALDEQRRDFRPLRFDDRVGTDTTLEEVWFPGGHCDVGGGCGSASGLEYASRHWMMGRYENDEIFEPDPTNCSMGCEIGPLHDAFLEKPDTYGRLGIHWRRAIRGDKIHRSIKCRMQAKLPFPHPQREVELEGRTAGGYRPSNLYSEDLWDDVYEVVDWPCTDPSVVTGPDD